jgi:AraC family transcriptional regulator
MNIGIAAHAFQPSLEGKQALQTLPAVSSLAVAGIVISRVWSDEGDVAALPPTPCAEAFDVSVELRRLEHFQLLCGRDLVACGPRDEASLSILDLTQSWQFRPGGAFDRLHFQIPFDVVRRFVADAGHPLFMGMGCKDDHLDPVMFALAKALLPALEHPHDANVLFVERIGQAVLTHLTQTYGGIYFPADKKGTLAPWQERRVRSFLEAHFHQSVAVADLADMCALSRSYFIKAFKESFGRTPYRWLSEYRVAQARDLLTSDLSLAEIAIACGFSDQSHLTRNFTDLLGISPGQFRRQNRVDAG